MAQRCMSCEASILSPAQRLHFYVGWIILILMFICVCNAVTERDVLAAVAEGAQSLADLQGQLGLASCCGACANLAQEYLPGGCYAVSEAVPSQSAMMAQAATLMSMNTTFSARAVSRSPS